MIKKIWKVLTPILSAIMGIWAANKFNIFELITFVPKDYTYEVCITTYFVIADVIIDTLLNAISIFLKPIFISELEVVISHQGTVINSNTDINLEFNTDGLTQANILLKIKGKKIHFQNTDLIIKKPAFAEIQSAYKRQEVIVDSDNYRIKLADLFGNSSTIDSSQTFRIVMIQDAVDGDTSMVLTPELSKKRIGLIYKHNNANLKAVRR